MTTANRNHKDSFFRLVFGDHRENALSLYNAINGTEYTEPEKLEIMTIKDALYIGIKNDVAFLFDGSINLYEHQSTYNPNMPLRGLGYFSTIYNGYIEKHCGGRDCLYAGCIVKIPTPKYYVFYNGQGMQEDKLELRLSDAYDGIGDLEIVAHVININEGRNKELFDACKPLREYSQVIARIRENKAKEMEDTDAVNEAIKWCIGKGIMVDMLVNESLKATNSLITGLTEEEERRLKERELQWAREEAQAEGLAEGRAEGRAEGLAEGRAEGLAEGHAEGLAEGADTMGRLFRVMEEAGHLEDFRRATEDPDFFHDLCEEYGISQGQK